MKYVAFIVWLLISSMATAEEKSPGERMMVAMGIDKLLDAQREAYKVDANKQVAILMKQLESTLSQLPKETTKEIEDVMSSMMLSLLDSWSVEAAVKVYSEEWDKNYTPSEIETVIEKYEDPSAKKELEVVMTASAALYQYLADSYNAAFEKSMAEAMPRIQQVISKGRQQLQPNNSIQPTANASAD